MDSSFPCPGCSKTFSKAKSRRSHLTQTTNPACVAIRNIILTSECGLPLPPTLSAFPPNEHDFNAAENHHTASNPDQDDDSDMNSEGDGLGNSDPNLQNEGMGPGYEGPTCSPTPQFIFLPEELQVEPVKVPFPGRQAGEVSLEGVPTMKEYENNLGGPTTNPYSPFNSEIDWNLAKWARLRGPSATAFTESLQINSVCPIHTPKIFFTHIP
jgi:hypothetical protein